MIYDLLLKLLFASYEINSIYFSNNVCFIWYSTQKDRKSCFNSKLQISHNIIHSNIVQQKQSVYCKIMRSPWQPDTTFHYINPWYLGMYLRTYNSICTIYYTSSYLKFSMKIEINFTCVILLYGKLIRYSRITKKKECVWNNPSMLIYFCLSYKQQTFILIFLLFRFFFGFS